MKEYREKMVAPGGETMGWDQEIGKSKNLG